MSDNVIKVSDNVLYKPENKGIQKGMKVLYKNEICKVLRTNASQEVPYEIYKAFGPDYTTISCGISDLEIIGDGTFTEEEKIKERKAFKEGLKKLPKILDYNDLDNLHRIYNRYSKYSHFLRIYYVNRSPENLYYTQSEYNLMMRIIDYDLKKELIGEIEHGKYMEKLIAKSKEKEIIEKGFKIEKEQYLVLKITKTLYIRDRLDGYYDFLNSRFNRKNNKIYFEDFEILKNSITLKHVKTLERHCGGKNRINWQYRKEIEVSKDELKWLYATPLQWEK